MAPIKNLIFVCLVIKKLLYEGSSLEKRLKSLFLSKKKHNQWPRELRKNKILWDGIPSWERKVETAKCPKCLADNEHRRLKKWF